MKTLSFSNSNLEFKVSKSSKESSKLENVEKLDLKKITHWINIIMNSKEKVPTLWLLEKKNWDLKYFFKIKLFY